MSYKIGEVIKKRRTELKLTQKDLYKRMGIEDTGIISKYECGDVIPPTEMLPLLAKALEVSVAYLFDEVSESSSADEREWLHIFRMADDSTKIKYLNAMRCLSA